jgi:hypothetical protein
MAIQIQLRNDTGANWESANPTLASGEVGVEIDTNKMKIGVGNVAWNDLPYTGVDVDELVPLISYEHTQGISDAEWVIQHNLGFYPSVTVFDSALSEVEGAIEHQDVNSLTITFSVAISGTAYLS